MPKMKTHKGAQNVLEEQVLVNLNVLMRLQATCSEIKHRNKNVNYVKAQSLLKATKAV